LFETRFSLKMFSADDCDGKPGVFHPRKRVNRQTKLHLVFDPKARRYVGNQLLK